MCRRGRVTGSRTPRGTGGDGPRHTASTAAVDRYYARPMTKWEYATVPLLVHATKQILDTWGEDGWELVQVVPGPNNPEQLVAYLKREKQA